MSLHHWKTLSFSSSLSLSVFLSFFSHIFSCLPVDLFPRCSHLFKLIVSCFFPPLSLISSLGERTRHIISAFIQLRRKGWSDQKLAVKSTPHCTHKSSLSRWETEHSSSDAKLSSEQVTGLGLGPSQQIRCSCSTEREDDGRKPCVTPARIQNLLEIVPTGFVSCLYCFLTDFVKWLSLAFHQHYETTYLTVRHLCLPYWGLLVHIKTQLRLEFFIQSQCSLNPLLSAFWMEKNGVAVMCWWCHSYH